MQSMTRATAEPSISAVEEFGRPGVWLFVGNDIFGRADDLRAAIL
jgi:hypothetical protein